MYKLDRGTGYWRDPEMTVPHRERGLPAYEYTGEGKSYYENSQWHRLDGVARDWKHRKYHFLNGKSLFEKL